MSLSSELPRCAAALFTFSVAACGGDDTFVGVDEETVEALLTKGSAVATSTTTGSFLRRAGHDIVEGVGVPPDTVVLTHDTDDQLTLSTPWPSATSKVMLKMHHDERNYCVHFSMDEQ